MKQYVETLVEIPCFKCLFWNPIKDSHLHCNPNECRELTEWLLEQVENQKQSEESSMVSFQVKGLKTQRNK